MARATGRKAQLTSGVFLAAAVALAPTLLTTTAHAQTSRGLLASPDPLTAPSFTQQQDDSDSAQPSTGAPAEGGSNSGPGAGGATINVGGNGAAVLPPTNAGAAPQADQPQQEKRKQGMTIYDRLAGSSFYSLTGTTIGTIFKGYQPDYNPTVYTYGLLAPRFAINKEWQIRARTGFNLEYTNSDTTTYRNEFEMIDSAVQLFYRGIPAIAGMVKFTPFVQAMFPTSKQSRARTMIFTPGVGLQGAMGIEHFAGGSAIFIASFIYSRPIYKYQTPNGPELPYQPNCIGGSDCGGQMAGTRNARDTFSTSVIFAPSWGKVAPGAWFLLANQVAYKGKSGLVELPNGETSTNTRTSTFFALWVDYELNDWLTPEIGYQQQRNLRADDGGWGNPFFSNKQQQTLYIGANFQLDSLLKKLAGEQGQGGVVRAKAAPNPIRFY